MKRIFYSLIVLSIVVVFISCTTKVYTRTLIYKKSGADLRISETLELTAEHFKFVKETSRGKAVFTGDFERKQNSWIFKIKYFKPLNAAERYFEPPIIYIYRVRKIPNGVQFDSPTVKGGRSPLQFIMKGSFVLH